MQFVTQVQILTLKRSLSNVDRYTCNRQYPSCSISNQFGWQNMNQKLRYKDTSDLNIFINLIENCV